MKNMNSHRHYIAAYIEYDRPLTSSFSLMDVLDDTDDMEWKYAVQDEIDKLLDLKIGERMQCQFNRDNFDSQGWIKRIL